MSKGYALGKYFVLWFCYIILFVVSVMAVELIEASKIPISELDGMHAMGFVFIFIVLAAGIALYIVTFLPLSLLCNWLLRNHIIRVIIYVIVAIAGGLLLFVTQYGTYLLDGRGYGLNAWTPCIVFGIAALIYGYVEHLLNNKIKAQKTIE